MSKTGEWIVESIEKLSTETGYPFRFLMVKYFANINALESIGSDEDPMEVLVARARAGEFVLPNDCDKTAKDNEPRLETVQDIEDMMKLFGFRKRPITEGKTRIIVDTSEIDKALQKLRQLSENAARIRAVVADAENNAAKWRENNHVEPSMIFDHSTGELHYVDPETAKIRKHTHDTLWEVLAGFAAGAAMVVIFGMIVLAILSYALG